MVPPAAIEVEAITDTQAVTVPEPFLLPQKINETYGRRNNLDKSQWGVAAHASSAQFKSLGCNKGKPKAKRWDHRLTLESHSRRGNSLKQAAKFLSNPGMISLGGGLPSSAYFPFSSMSMQVPVAPHFSEDDTLSKGALIESGKHDLVHGKSIFDISTAFNYGQGSGSAQLLRWVTEHTELIHRPPYADWACNLTIGSTSALDIALRMFVSRGDYFLAEEFTFSAAIETATPMGVKAVGIPMDEQGLLPDVLDRILDEWSPEERGGARKPFLLYTVPTGQNPTGATQGPQRRRDVYRVCQKHDLYILEDEPYYFLQMPEYSSTSMDSKLAAPTPDPTDPSGHDAFLQSLAPSFLSMDIDGRVMRMDSFSKVVAPGSRVGWVTASEQIIERFKMHVDVATQGPCGMSQLILFKLLDEHWGHEGYIDWLMYIRREYTMRRDVIVSASEAHLPREVVSWEPPKAGMFHWFKLDWQKHPNASTKTFSEVEEEIFMASIKQGALVMRGSWFRAESDSEQNIMFFRATFAAAPFDQIQEAIRRFGVALRVTFNLQSTNGHQA